METRRLTGDDWRTLRDVRLIALADAPHAYGSTLAEERAIDEAGWRHRLDLALFVLATLDGEHVGVVGMILPQDDGDLPMLIAMWVSPAHRGHGIGDALVGEILSWVKEISLEQSWSHVVLRVADGNDPARKLFLRHGFTPTGQRVPLESDTRVLTETLSRAL